MHSQVAGRLEGWRVRLGAAFWIGTLQFFIAETVVQSRWAIHYDRRDYYISDLGALHCDGNGGGLPVCSPWHTLMNVSFVVQGLLIICGALLLHPLWVLTSSGAKAITATALLVAAGVGVALVGLAPEDTVSALHVVGAAANFAAGNAGLVMLYVLGRGFPGVAGTSRIGVLGAVWAGVLGAIGLAALVAFVVGSDWGLGPGGIERVIAYPLPAALPVVAVAAVVLPQARQPRSHSQQ